MAGQPPPKANTDPNASCETGASVRSATDKPHFQLPPELLPLILAHLDRQTLLECCTVDRVYHLEAIRVLYRDIRWTTLRMDARLSARWMRLVRRIAGDPQVASFVKCFSIVAAHRMWKLTSQGMGMLRDAIGNMKNLELLEVIGIDRNSTTAFTRWTTRCAFFHLDGRFGGKIIIDSLSRLHSGSVTRVHMISCVHIAALAAPTYIPSIRELLFISCSIPRHLTSDSPTSLSASESLPHISRLGCSIDDASLPAFIASHAHAHISHLILNSAPASSALANAAAARLAEVYLACGRPIHHLELQTHHSLAIVTAFVDVGAAHLLDGQLTIDPAKCGPLQMVCTRSLPSTYRDHDVE